MAELEHAQIWSQSLPSSGACEAWRQEQARHDGGTGEAGEAGEVSAEQGAQWG